MRNTKLILLIIIAIPLFSFQWKVNLQSDKQLNGIFSKSEIKEIEKMVSYVDSMVLKNTNTADINEAYHRFLEKLNQTIQDSSKFLVPFEEEKKYQFLESLDSTVFNDFWQMGNFVKISRYKGTIYRDLDGYKHLNLHPFGRYMAYLEKVGKEDDFYKSLKENIEISGDIPVSMSIWVPANHQKFDFNLPKNRLWVTVYILRIEEHHDKKMERYLNRKKSLDNKYFLLGTLRDYMGREKYQQVNGRVDRYHQSEGKLCFVIDSMFKDSYPDLRITTAKNHDYELYSVSLAGEMDNFYNFQTSGRMNINARLDTMTQFSDSILSGLLQTADTIYFGRLKSGIFETDRQKLSFITGAFVRYGRFRHSAYYISVANSVSKVKVLTQLLKEMNCENVEYKIQESIPFIHTVYFTPTEEMTAYFNKYLIAK
jgi:hypothetical protein